MHLVRRYSVPGKQHADQQGADAVGSVDPDRLARELGDGGDSRVRGGDQHARARLQGGGLSENAEPGSCGLRRDVSDVASGADVDLALELIGDDRLAAGYLLDPHVQPLPGEEPWSCAMYSPARSTAGMAATVIYGSPGCGSAEVNGALPAVAHPAARTVIIAMSGAAHKLRVFICASRASRPRSWPHADGCTVPADKRPRCRSALMIASRPDDGGLPGKCLRVS